MRQNQGLLKISFSTFWLGDPKCTETDLKKSLICPIWGQSEPIWMSNLTSPEHTEKEEKITEFINHETEIRSQRHPITIEIWSMVPRFTPNVTHI